MSGKIKEIERCRICGNTNLIEVMNLGNLALSGCFIKDINQQVLEAPMVLVKCDQSSGGCGLVQLKHTCPLDMMYMNEYGYRSGINRTMKEHLNGIVDMINEKVSLKEGDVVLDIGSNDGTLLNRYPDFVTRVGIDPTTSFFKQYYKDDVLTFDGFFNSDAYKNILGDRKAKIITSIAMFYDLEDPNVFVKDIKSILAEDGIWFFEQHYMPEMVRTNSFDAICHEHLEYYGLSQIMWMMERHGLRMFDVCFRSSNGGSFQVFVCHDDADIVSDTNKIDRVLEQERADGFDTGDPFVALKERVDLIGKNLVDLLKDLKKQGKVIYGYGASTKGNVLLQYFGIDDTLLDGIADRNPLKWGRWTPKTGIPIVSEDVCRLVGPDVLLVLPWHFRDEFVDREKEFLAAGGMMIFPLPSLDIVNDDR